MTLTYGSLKNALVLVLVLLFAAGYGTFHSTTTTPARRFDSGRMFDKFGALRVKDENARLDNLATQLKREPRSKSYLVLYEGSDDRIRDLRSRACRALKHLILRRGVNAKQVVALMISGAHRESFTVELWMWPIEASDDLPRFQVGVSENEASIIRGVEVTRKCCRRRQ